MIQLKKAGLVADREDVEGLRSHFEKQHWVRLPGLLDQELLALALSYIEKGQWRENVVVGFYSEYVLEIGAAVNLFHLVTNAPRFLEIVSEITGCDSLSWFEGRIYRMEPYGGHSDDWHNDIGGERKVAMSINLSTRPYQGGLLQMRERKSHRMLGEIANLGPGDALLFRVSRHLQHRVTEVQAGEPKTAFAGWFSTKPGIRERVSRLSSDATPRSGSKDPVGSDPTRD